MIRLTVSVDAPPTPALQSAFPYLFFGGRLALEYDYMCSETDFTQENKRISLAGKCGLL